MTTRARAWYRFRRNRGALLGLGLLVLAVTLAVLAPLIATHAPNVQEFDTGLSAMGAPVPPSDTHIFGTDALGRDVWSRLVHGASISLTVAAMATLIALVLGLAVGLCAGYVGGALDTALMRFVDLVLAFPFLLLAILLAALLRDTSLGDGTAKVYITLGAVSWTTMARVVRGKVMSVRQQAFIESARAVGASGYRIVRRHVVPNIVGPVIILATITMAQMILAESVLSYLGLGAPPPTASWGRMLFDGQSYYRIAPWLIIAPGVAIVVTVLGFNLFGEGLRDALDPKDKR